MKNMLKSIITVGVASMLLINCGSDSASTASTGATGSSSLPAASGTLTFTGADSGNIIAGTTFNAANYTLSEVTGQYTLNLNPDSNSTSQATSVTYQEAAGLVSIIITSSNPTDAVASLKTWTAFLPAGVVIDKTARTITFTSVSTARSGGSDVIIDGTVNY